MELSTARLLLRHYRHADASALHEAKLASFPELSTWMPWGKQLSTMPEARETISRFQQKAENETEYALGIFLRSNGTFVGSTGYTPHKPEVPSYEIGYWISTPHRKQGYMREAVHALTSHLFWSGANRVFIRCEQGNTGSANVAIKLGYRQEGLLRNHARNNASQLVNQLVFAHTPESWRTFQEG